MKILVTGGAGFIGSHTVVELQQADYDVVVLDNLSNSSEKSLERVEAITGKKVPFYRADILDREALEKIFSEEKPDAEKTDRLLLFCSLSLMFQQHLPVLASLSLCFCHISISLCLYVFFIL